MKQRAFDIERWFDTSHEIDRLQQALTEAQLMLEAVKNDIDPAGAEAHQQYRAMDRAVERHNRKFCS